MSFAGQNVSSVYGFIGTLLDITTGYAVGLQGPTGQQYLTSALVSKFSNSTDTVVVQPFSKGAYLNSVIFLCSSSGEQMIQLTDTTGVTTTYAFGIPSAAPAGLPPFPNCDIDSINYSTMNAPSPDAILTSFFVEVNSNTATKIGSLSLVGPLLGILNNPNETGSNGLSEATTWITTPPIVTLLSSATTFNGVVVNNSGEVIGLEAANGEVMPTIQGQSTSNGTAVSFPSALYSISFATKQSIATDTFHLVSSSSTSSSSATSVPFTFPANSLPDGLTSPYHQTDNVNLTTANIVISLAVGQNPSTIATISLGPPNFEWVNPSNLFNILPAATPSTSTVSPATAPVSATAAAPTSPSSTSSSSPSTFAASASSSSPSTTLSPSTASSTNPMVSASTTSSTPASTTSTTSTTSPSVFDRYWYIFLIGFLLIVAFLYWWFEIRPSSKKNLANRTVVQKTQTSVNK